MRPSSWCERLCTKKSREEKQRGSQPAALWLQRSAERFSPNVLQNCNWPESQKKAEGWRRDPGFTPALLFTLSPGYPFACARGTKSLGVRSLKSAKGSGKGRQAGGCSALPLISHWLGRTGESKPHTRQPNVGSQLEVLARALPAAPGRPGRWRAPSAVYVEDLVLPQRLSLTLFPFFPFPFALSSLRDRLLFFPTVGVWDRRPLPAANANHARRWWQ